MSSPIRTPDTSGTIGSTGIRWRDRARACALQAWRRSVRSAGQAPAGRPQFASAAQRKRIRRDRRARAATYTIDAAARPSLAGRWDDEEVCEA